MASEYVTVIRVLFSAPDDIEARIIADMGAERIASGLDDSDLVKVLDVTQLSTNAANEVIAQKLESAKRELLATRDAAMYDVARELDKAAHYFRIGSLVNYDYAAMVEESRQLSKRKGDSK